MPEQVLQNAMLALDGLDLSAMTSQIRVEQERPLLDSTVFGTGTRRSTPGVPAARLSFSGYFDAGAIDLALFDAVNASVGSEAVVSAAIPAAAGGLAYLLQLRPGRYQQGGRFGEVWPLELQGEGLEHWSRGVVLESDTKTASGNGSAQVLDALLAAETLVGHLHVLGGTFTSLDVTVESDDDPGFPSPITRLTFTNVASAPAVRRETLAGPITPDTQYRATWTLVGTDALILVTIGTRPI